MIAPFWLASCCFFSAPQYLPHENMRPGPERSFACVGTCILPTHVLRQAQQALSRQERSWRDIRRSPARCNHRLDTATHRQKKQFAASEVNTSPLHLGRNHVEQQPAELCALRELGEFSGDKVVDVGEGVLGLGVPVKLLPDLSREEQ